MENGNIQNKQKVKTGNEENHYGETCQSKDCWKTDKSLERKVVQTAKTEDWEWCETGKVCKQQNCESSRNWSYCHSFTKQTNDLKNRRSVVNRCDVRKTTKNRNTNFTMRGKRKNGKPKKPERPADRWKRKWSSFWKETVNLKHREK